MCILVTAISFCWVKKTLLGTVIKTTGGQRSVIYLGFEEAGAFLAIKSDSKQQLLSLLLNENPSLATATQEPLLLRGLLAETGISHEHGGQLLGKTTKVVTYW